MYSGKSSRVAVCYNARHIQPKIYPQPSRYHRDVAGQGDRLVRTGRPAGDYMEEREPYVRLESDLATVLIRELTNSSTTNPEKYMAEYHTVLSAIRHFRSYLPSLTCQDAEGPESQLSRTSMGLISERLYPHFIVMNAQIQLYNILEETSPVAYDSCLKSARDIAALISQLNDLEIAQLGVMMGVSNHPICSGVYINQCRPVSPRRRMCFCAS